MRWLIGVIVFAFLGAFVTACDESDRGTSSASRVSSNAMTTHSKQVVENPSEASSLPGLRGDEDDDDSAGVHTTDTSHDNDADFDNDSKTNEPKAYYDSDDSPIRGYGEAADPSDSRAIAALVKRYYAAAAAANGARACSLVYSLFAEAIPEDYGRGAGPAYSRGDTCAVVLSKLFKHDHAQIPTSIVVSAVRIDGGQARALIGSKTAPAGYLTVRRERGDWKIDNLLAVQLP
ncbi:MAG: hypothetical protein ACRDK4_07945 [Solirubrobacteraceae bacterium]